MTGICFFVLRGIVAVFVIINWEAPKIIPVEYLQSIAY
ncbi:hypothetical protein AC36_3814 [Escherichia coli 4-203-08_S3_C2]|nr:hypothetical protein ECP03047993_2246 [Escherichia coli P0304799.3]EZJ76879.1 hypothetical protein AC27_4815 [Escherichia coli 1-182-04_S3_C2]EZJ84868.1 hypothetical protein AC56_5097 [Escherichia coli 1-182-04_S3_C3]EZK04541.1 hypothetical protein AB99_5550 [Escherichia coli 1-182-04_S3_C1]KDS95489.1 hypothetical protein AC66_4914 [Escherichia coli 2-011-08_S4_C1]KDT09292.1 hypothetical protein AD24_4948 [Escherichia coli 2-011-08_S4_C3]KDT19881.1 hypothetical protein AB84_2192 [Escherich